MLHVTLFNISNEKIEPLSFFCNISCGKKKVMSPLICLTYQSLILLCREYEMLRMLPGSLNKLNLLYIFPYILVHI